MKSLYVATNMECFEYDNPELLGTDFYINGQVHRKLDPDYLIWLSSRFDIAFKHADKGKLSFEALSLISDRLTRIEEAAKQLFNVEEIKKAKKKSRAFRYNPPKNKNDIVFKTQNTVKQNVKEPEVEVIESSSPKQLNLPQNQNNRLTNIGENR